MPRIKTHHSPHARSQRAGGLVLAREANLDVQPVTDSERPACLKFHRQLPGMSARFTRHVDRAGTFGVEQRVGKRDDMRAHSREGRIEHAEKVFIWRII